MQAHQHSELGKHVIRDDLLLGLMCIRTIEIFSVPVDTCILWQVLLKQRKAKKVAVDEVVKDSVT